MTRSFDVDRINIRSLKVYYDERTRTRVSEQPYMVHYESQHFRCKATIELEDSISTNHWSIGLVQACDNMYLENRYGRYGSSFWEFHPLKARYHSMVNDSDGRQYPFYSASTSKVDVYKGVVASKRHRLHYGDHFYPTVAWQLPYCGGVQLTDIVRRQDFWVWLVAIRRQKSNMDVFDASKEDIHLLKTMRWRYNLHLKFDPSARLGHRLRAVKDEQEELPVIMDSDTPIPLSAVHAPHCNAAQSLIWYPKVSSERPTLLVPPKQSIVPWNRWVDDMIPTAKISLIRPPGGLGMCNLWLTDAAIDIGSRKRLLSVGAIAASDSRNFKRHRSLVRHTTARRNAANLSRSVQR